MQGWVLMAHDNEVDCFHAHGDLIGNFYSDIESACRHIEDGIPGVRIVGVEYFNDGEKAVIRDNKGHIFGAYLCKMPMREDVLTKW